MLFDGFFPVAAREERPRRSRGGLHEFGLPYAADAAITRHLAAFLTRHGIDRVDVLLFNGGAMTPASLRQRVRDQIAAWQPAAGAPEELSSRTPELAVAQGAAHYGLVRRGLGARIGGGTPRSFYVGVAGTRRPHRSRGLPGPARPGGGIVGDPAPRLPADHQPPGQLQAVRLHHPGRPARRGGTARPASPPPSPAAPTTPWI